MAKKNGLRKTRRRVRDDGWRPPDALWAKMEPLPPPPPPHPPGRHHPRRPAPAAAPAGLSQPARAGPCGNGCDLLRAPHRVSLECPARDPYLLVLLGASALSGMGQGGRVRSVLARRAAGL